MSLSLKPDLASVGLRPLGSSRSSISPDKLKLPPRLTTRGSPRYAAQPGALFSFSQAETPEFVPHLDQPG